MVKTLEPLVEPIPRGLVALGVSDSNPQTGREETVVNYGLGSGTSGDNSRSYGCKEVSCQTCICVCEMPA